MRLEVKTFFQNETIHIIPAPPLRCQFKAPYKQLVDLPDETCSWVVDL